MVMFGPYAEEEHIVNNSHAIRRQLRLIVRIHLVFITLWVVFATAAAATALAYYPHLRGPLSGPALAAAIDDAYGIMDNARNITADLAAVTASMRGVMTSGSADGISLAAHGRHLLLDAAPALTPDVQAAAAALLRTLNEKASPPPPGRPGEKSRARAPPPDGRRPRHQAAQMDVTAPTDLIRYLMAIHWKEDLAPRFDSTVKSVQRAELLAGVVLRSLATSSAETKTLDDEF